MQGRWAPTRVPPRWRGNAVAGHSLDRKQLRSSSDRPPDHEEITAASTALPTHDGRETEMHGAKDGGARWVVPGDSFELHPCAVEIAIVELEQSCDGSHLSPNRSRCPQRIGVCIEDRIGVAEALIESKHCAWRTMVRDPERRVSRGVSVHGPTQQAERAVPSERCRRGR